jgi:hypothetical protein
LHAAPRGFCHSTNKPWRIEEVPVADLKPGPIRYKALPKALLEQARWTYEVVGRLVKPAFEQWELSFLRDLRPDRELAIWCKIANAYISFLARKGREPETMTNEVGKSLLSALLLISMGGDPTPTERLPPETISALADCYARASPHRDDKG